MVSKYLIGGAMTLGLASIAQAQNAAGAPGSPTSAGSASQEATTSTGQQSAVQQSIDAILKAGEPPLVETLSPTQPNLAGSPGPTSGPMNGGANGVSASSAGAGR